MNVRALVEKTLSTIFSLVLFAFMSTGMHEQFHYLAAQLVGLGNGIVGFGWFSGVYNWPVGVSISPFQDAVVGLAGGLGAGAVLFIIWWFADHWLKYTNWELDDCIAIQVVMVTQFVYAIFDGFFRSLSVFGANLGVVVGFIIACIIYGPRFIRWLAE